MFKIMLLVSSLQKSEIGRFVEIEIACNLYRLIMKIPVGALPTIESLGCPGETGNGQEHNLH